MQTEEDSLTTLSKWPFILGDALLVTTALAIAILGDWQLTNWQVASCVISVALGAAFYVLPYIVEFQVRLREEREDRGAELRILQRNVVSGQEELEAAGERIEVIELGLRKMSQSASRLSAPIEALENKIEPVVSKQSEQTDQLAGLTKQIEALSFQIADKLNPDALKSLEADLVSIKQEIKELTSNLPARITPQSEPSKNDSAADSIEPEKSSTKPQEHPNRSPRERKDREPRLLKRAIDQKQDKSSTAVSRIIESKHKEDTPTNAAIQPKAKDEDRPGLGPVEKSDPKPEASTANLEADEVNQKVAVKDLEPVENEVKPASKEVSAQVAQDEVSTLEEKPESKPELKTEPKSEANSKLKEEPKPSPKPEPKREPEKEATPAQSSNDMFGESVPTQNKKWVRTSKSDSAVIATVFIGIGNKPYVRGDGAGLNWDSGVEMEFEEIGKWRWIAPSDLAGPVEIQLYRNDKDADRSGKYTLAPGQQLDLSPVF